MREKQKQVKGCEILYKIIKPKGSWREKHTDMRGKTLPPVPDTLPTLPWWGRIEDKSLGKGRCGTENTNLQSSH